MSGFLMVPAPSYLAAKKLKPGKKFMKREELGISWARSVCQTKDRLPVWSDLETKAAIDCFCA